MAFSVVMPALEMAQETGKLVAWRKKEGERVAKGEPLLEIETDKAVLEVEAPTDGILAGVKAHAGAVVPVGQTIAWIVLPGEVLPSEVTPPVNPAATASGSAPAAMRPPQQPALPGVNISPKARRLAKEHGVDISRLHGSGPGGEILASDVLALAESRRAPLSSSVETASLEKPGPVGRLMAERTTQSWTSVPHFFVVRDVDVGALVEARERLGPSVEQACGVRLTHTDLLVALVARLLVKHPRVNASWSADGIRLHREVNISVAMAVNDGVVAPVIRNAHRRDLGEIVVQRRDLTERARAGRLHPADITGATFTVSNLGMYSVDAFSAIINPPQGFILAVGKIDKAPVVDDCDQIVVGHRMSIWMSCDHRVIDGALGAQYLREVRRLLENPALLLV